ncbi:MAG TPA: hypothetical protein DDW80_07120 [Desulfovibrio sp.]|nr:hypothetical protein [Desulfovibrio sp.]
MALTWILVRLDWLIVFLPLAPYAWLFLARRQTMKEFKISRLEAVLDAYVPENENILYVFKGSALYLAFLVFVCLILAWAYDLVLRHFLRGRALTAGDIKFILCALLLFPTMAAYYLNATLTVFVITDQRVCVSSLATRFRTRVVPLSQVQALEPSIPLGYGKTRVVLKDGTSINLLRPKNRKDFLAAKQALGL